MWPRLLGDMILVPFNSQFPGLVPHSPLPGYTIAASIDWSLGSWLRAQLLPYYLHHHAEVKDVAW